MKDVFEFDSVEETFSIVHSGVIDDEIDSLTREAHQLTIEQESRYAQDETVQASNLQREFDNPVSESEDDAEDNSIIKQLKERRKQLEQDLLKAIPSTPNIYPRKAKKDEKKEKLNELREQVVPGATPLVIDTNCFIGELANVKKVIECAKWQIIIPLVGTLSFSIPVLLLLSFNICQKSHHRIGRLAIKSFDVRHKCAGSPCLS